MVNDPNQSLNPSTSEQSSPKSERRLPPGWKSAVAPSEGEVEQQEQNSKYLYLSSSILEKSQNLLPLMGYGLFIYSFVDFLYFLIPPRLTDPGWQFETMGRMVEYVWFPLFGFIFIFSRRQGYIKKGEVTLLKFFSWLCLLAGIVYLLMVPLGVNNTRRIYQSTEAAVNQQIAQTNEQVKTLEQRFAEANTPQALSELLAQLNPQGRAPEITNLGEVKEQLSQGLDQSKQNFKQQIEAQKKAQNQLLFKNSIKWNLGALISATWFFLIWSNTSWIRKLNKPEIPKG